MHWHPCAASGTIASSVQIYACNNLRAAEQIFMKFGSEEFKKIVELLEFSVR